LGPVVKKTFVSGVYIVFFWIVIPFILVVSSLVIDRSIVLPLITGSNAVGWFIAIVSAGLLLISIVQFAMDAGTLPISAYPPGHIVRRGVYAFYRHPIYLFYATMFVGIALILGSTGMLFVVLPIFIVGMILYASIEERTLLRRFGQDYQAYKEQAGVVIPRFHMILSIPFFILSKLFFPITVVNKHYIPKEAPFFLVANHRNYLDPVLISCTLPYKVHYITTYEMFRKRLNALFFSLLGCIPKKRYLYDSTTVKQIIQVLKKGGVIGIFPEGERSYTGDLLDLKPEPMKLFQKFRAVPILPVSISGNYIMWPRWGRGWRTCTITVTYHTLIKIHPDETLETLRGRIATSIQPDDTGSSTTYRKRAHSIECFLYRCPACREFDSLHSRNEFVFCERCGRTWHIQKDYSVIDTGNRQQCTVQEMYDRLCITPSDVSLQPADMRSGPCRCFVEHGVMFEYAFSGYVAVCDDNLIAQPDDPTIEPIVIPMRDLLSATIEGNRKLQVYNSALKKAFQFIFEYESARKWQDYIAEVRYAMCSEYPIVR
jgi:1-acyl-sn-glycerol-3-phosphate acyltransferase